MNKITYNKVPRIRSAILMFCSLFGHSKYNMQWLKVFKSVWAHNQGSKIRNIILLPAIFFILAPTIYLNAQSDSTARFFAVDGNRFIYYFDESGSICLEDVCDYYRSIHYPIETFPFFGEINDFYKNGVREFKGYIRDGQLEGKAEYYDKNGDLEIEGEYKDGKRYGVWTYYFPDHRLEKKLLFNEDKLYILELYGKNGNQLVAGGNGLFKGKTQLGPGHDLVYKISGPVKDSLMDGKWTISGRNEIYKKGRSIKGYGTCLSDFFNPISSEKMQVFLSLRVSSYNAVPPLYKDSLGINDFFDDIKIELNKINRQNSLPTYWGLVSFKIEKSGNLDELHFISSEEIINKKLIQFIVSSKWQAAREKEVILDKNTRLENTTTIVMENGTKMQIGNVPDEDTQLKDFTDTYIYFPFVHLNGEIIIPELYFQRLDKK